MNRFRPFAPITGPGRLQPAAAAVSCAERAARDRSRAAAAPVPRQHRCTTARCVRVAWTGPDRDHALTGRTAPRVQLRPAKAHTAAEALIASLEAKIKDESHGSTASSAALALAQQEVTQAKREGTASRSARRSVRSVGAESRMAPTGAGRRIPMAGGHARTRSRGSHPQGARRNQALGSPAAVVRPNHWHDDWRRGASAARRAGRPAGRAHGPNQHGPHRAA